MSEYVDVKDLDDSIRSALESAGFNKSNIRVEVVEKLELGNDAFGDGYRAYTTLVNLTTGERHTSNGSWGGANPFNPTNAVDNDHREYVLPPNGVVVKGQKGGGRPVSGTLYIPAAMRARVLPAGPTQPLPTVELDALYCHSAVKGGTYRKDELRRRRVPASVLDDLVSRGLLSRNKAGAMAITTAGRNAVSGYTPSYVY